MGCLWRAFHANQAEGLMIVFMKPKERLGLPWWLSGEESSRNAGDMGLTPGLGRYPGGGHGNLLQYSCLENLHGQRSLAGSSL